MPVAPLAGKVVVDTNNSRPRRSIAGLDDHSATSAGLLQGHLPTSKVVKAFNHIRSAPARDRGHAGRHPGRRALALFGDDAGARATVERCSTARLRRRGRRRLAESWRISPAPGVRSAAGRRRDASRAGRGNPLRPVHGVAAGVSDHAQPVSSSAQVTWSRSSYIRPGSRRRRCARLGRSGTVGAGSLGWRPGTPVAPTGRSSPGPVSGPESWGRVPALVRLGCQVRRHGATADDGAPSARAAVPPGRR